MSIRKDVEALIASEVTAYKISKDIQIPASVVQKLRLGMTQIDNMPLRNAEKLSVYYKQLKRKGEID